MNRSAILTKIPRFADLGDRKKHFLLTASTTDLLTEYIHQTINENQYHDGNPFYRVLGALVYTCVDQVPLT